jgi:D-alanyl-D-alanine carboxypeptidase
VHPYPKRQLAVLAILVVVLTAVLFVSLIVEQNKAGVVLGATYNNPVYSIPLTTEEPRGMVVSAKSPEVVAVTKFNAKAVLVYEPDSDTILFSQNADTELPIASLTKLMTAVVSMEDPGFSKPVKINGFDILGISPSLYLKTGDSVYPEDLLKAMLVGSANDAALTLANHLPNKNEFLVKMNTKAAQLGMNNTKFSNPMGFDSVNNYSTAADLKKLLSHALLVLPYDDLKGKPKYSFKSDLGYTYSVNISSQISATNPEISLIKTGFSAAAMENIIVENKVTESSKLVIILLGAKDRELEAKRVADFVKQQFIFAK